MPSTGTSGKPTLPRLPEKAHSILRRCLFLAVAKQRRPPRVAGLLLTGRKRQPGPPPGRPRRRGRSTMYRNPVLLRRHRTHRLTKNRPRLTKNRHRRTNRPADARRRHRSPRMRRRSMARRRTAPPRPRRRSPRGPCRVRVPSPRSSQLHQGTTPRHPHQAEAHPHHFHQAGAHHRPVNPNHCQQPRQARARHRRGCPTNQCLRLHQETATCQRLRSLNQRRQFHQGKVTHRRTR
jgi:hypothetical protein